MCLKIISQFPFNTANFIGGWHLQESSGTAADDFSSGSTTFDGVLTNGATWIADGVVVNPVGLPPSETVVSAVAITESAVPGIAGNQVFGDKAGHTAIHGLDVDILTGATPTSRLKIEDALITAGVDIDTSNNDIQIGTGILSFGTSLGKIQDVEGWLKIGSGTEFTNGLEILFPTAIGNGFYCG